MSVSTALILSNIGLIVAVALIITFVCLWLNAEWKFFKMGGKTWVFRTPPRKVADEPKQAIVEHPTTDQQVKDVIVKAEAYTIIMENVWRIRSKENEQK